MALKPKHTKAVDHYLKGLTKEKAMLKAGYSASMSKTRPQDVFGREDVKAEIARRQAIASTRADVTLEWIVERLAKIADANLMDMITEEGKLDISQMTPELRSAITGWTVDEIKSGRGKDAADIKRTKVMTADKLRALEMLTRFLGLSKEKLALELTGEVGMIERIHNARDRARAQDAEPEG